MKSHLRLFVALVAGAVAISLVSCSKGGTSATSPVDLSPPQAPTNLHSTTDTNINRDWLVWDLSASANVGAYEIYSSSTVGGAGSLVTTVDPSTSNYLLPIVGTETLEYYRVRAIGTNDVPSAFTATLGVDRSAWSGSPSKTGDKNKGTEPF